MVNRSKERFYQFEPYYKRTDNQPGWQWEFLAAAADHKGRVALGANRIGKSEMGAYEVCLAVTGQHPLKKYPANGIAWVVGLDNAMIRDIDRPMINAFLPSRFKTKFYKQDNIWECRCEDREWQIIFKSTEMGVDKFQGAQVDIAWVDEEPQKTEIFSEIETRLVDRGGNWLITATPLKGTAWLKELSERDDVYTTFAGMRDNPYLPIEEIEKLAANLSEDERLVRVEGEYVVWGGKPVFSRAMLRKIMQQIDRALPPEQGILIHTAA
jgi:phage terminase large subunit-like protein